jgi:superfamily I DNA/RNA helicase
MKIKFNTDDVTIFLAAAGSGKTTALMNEIQELLVTYRPDEIAFVTYTKKGVEHGSKQAVYTNPQVSEKEFIYFRTLHSLCYRELGIKQRYIFNESRIKRFGRKNGYNLTTSKAYNMQTDDDKLLIRYDVSRSGSLKGTYLEDEQYDYTRYTLLVKEYNKYKKEKKLIDFSDALLLFKKRNLPVNVKVAFIDEAQDLTPIQWEVCQIAFSICEKIYIAGDDYQSLFTYAGATPKTFINLAKKYKAVKLEKSYRLSEEVYRFSKGVTTIITDKIDKDFVPVKDTKGFVEEIGDRQLLARKIQNDLQDNGLKPYRWYLLFRTNTHINEVSELLEQHAIPYHNGKGFCLDTKELSKIERYYNYRKKGFSTKDRRDDFLEKFKIENINNNFTDSDLITSLRKYVYFDYVEKWGVEVLQNLATSEPVVLLSTTHRVKGSESDYVAVFLDTTRRVDKNALINTDEELRVLYVASTRAKIGVYLISSNTKYGNDKIVNLAREQMI